jgi:hypothetical protein
LIANCHQIEAIHFSLAMENGNFKEFACFTGRCEEVHLINEVNLKEFLNPINERALSKEGDLSLWALDKSKR